MTNNQPPLRLQVFPLTPERWADFEALFGPRGAYSGCWCTFWRLRRSDFGRTNADQRKQLMQDTVERGVVPGLLAYHDDRPVGWCSIGPREHFAALAYSRTLKPVDDLPVWSIVCFYITRVYRRKGLMAQLLRAAVNYAGEHGAQAVEAYPVDLESHRRSGTTLHGCSGYMGIASVFKTAGFQVVAQASETQPIMRYLLNASQLQGMQPAGGSA